MKNIILKGKVLDGKVNQRGDLIDPKGADTSNFKHNKVEVIHGDGKVEELKGYHCEPEIRVDENGKYHLLSISLCKNKK